MSDQESISFSFAVVGQKGVGKSSILKRFFGKDWDSGSNGTRNNSLLLGTKISD